MDAEAIRARLDHPVIDGDGHLVEFLPLVRDFMVELGGPGLGAGLDRVLDGPGLLRPLDATGIARIGGLERAPTQVDDRHDGEKHDADGDRGANTRKGAAVAAGDQQENAGENAGQ